MRECLWWVVGECSLSLSLFISLSLSLSSLSLSLSLSLSVCVCVCVASMLVKCSASFICCFSDTRLYHPTTLSLLVYFEWLQIIAFHTYSFRTFMYNEFHTIKHFDSGIFPDGQAVLEYYNMGNCDVTTDMIVLVGYALILQCLFYVVLLKKLTLL